MFDRLGAGHQLSVGYRGTRTTLFTIANLLISDHEANHDATPTPGGRTALMPLPLH